MQSHRAFGNRRTYGIKRDKIDYERLRTKIYGRAQEQLSSLIRTSAPPRKLPGANSTIKNDHRPRLL